MKAHQAAKGEPPLYDAAGYSLADVSAMANLAKAMAAGMNKSLPGLAVGSSTHGVVRDGETVAMLLQVTIAPEHANSSTMSKLPTIATKSWVPGGRITTRTISGTKVTVGTETRDGSPVAYYGWTHDGVLSMVVCVDDPGGTSKPAQAAAFAKAYLAATPA